MVTRTAKSYLAAYKSATEFFRSKHYLLDFFRLEKFIKANARSFQYVPPGNHFTNMAEVAVRDGKVHFVAVIGGVHPSFPVGEWDLLVSYAELPLNLLRQFSSDQSKSAHTGVYGTPFDFSAHSLASAGPLCVGFTPADVRPS